MFQRFEHKSSTEYYENSWTKDTIYKSEFFDHDSVPLYYYDTYVFEAKSPNAKSYKWKLGSDPKIYVGNSFSIGFTGGEGTLKITLITEFDENDPCNTFKKKYDTVEKYFTLVDDLNDMPYVGKKYVIKNGSTNEERTIEIFKGFYKCNASGTEGAKGPLICNLLDSFQFPSDRFNTSHYCSHEIFFTRPASCNFFIFDKKNSEDNTSKGILRIKDKSISIEMYQLIMIDGSNPKSLGIKPVIYYTGVEK
jgi:uncharacterized protein YrzB (UPF0473 family)